MATVVGITDEKAQEIADASIVSGAIDPVSGHLFLTTGGGTVIDAGLVTQSDIDLAEVPLTGTIAQFNVALSDGNFATLAGAETLTNKDLSDPSNVLPDAVVDMLALGLVARGYNNTTATGFTAEDLYMVTDAPITLIDGATYKVSVYCDPRSDTAGGFTTLKIRQGTSNTGITGLEVASCIKDHRAATRREGVAFFTVFDWTDPNQAGTYFKLTVTGSGGSSDIVCGTPSHIIVERFI